MVEEAAGADFAAEEEILLDRQFRHQAEFLEDRADPHHARRVRLKAGEALRQEPELAGVRSEGAGDDVDQGRFAGAVLAKQHMDLAGAQVEIDVVERQHAREALADADHLQEKVVAGRLRGPRSFSNSAVDHDDPAVWSGSASHGALTENTALKSAGARTRPRLILSILSLPIISGIALALFT